MKRSILGVASLALVIGFFSTPWRAAFARPQVATMHSTTISWTASVTPNVTYDVYRATSASGPFTKLNTSGIANTVFTDTTATPGIQYFYEVDAVDTVNGVVEDSGPSSQVSATEPNNPVPPTALVAVSK